MCSFAAGQLQSTDDAVTADRIGVSWSPSTGTFSFFNKDCQETSTVNVFDGGSDRKDYKGKVRRISTKERKNCNSGGVFEDRKSKPVVLELPDCEDIEDQKCKVLTDVLRNSRESTEVSDVLLSLPSMSWQQ